MARSRADDREDQVETSSTPRYPPLSATPYAADGNDALLAHDGMRSRVDHVVHDRWCITSLTFARLPASFASYAQAFGQTRPSTPPASGNENTALMTVVVKRGKQVIERNVEP